MLVFLPARAGGESEEEDAFRADEAVNAKPLTARRELACALEHCVTRGFLLPWPMKADKGTDRTSESIRTYLCMPTIIAGRLRFNFMLESGPTPRARGCTGTACACRVVGGGRDGGKARIFHLV